MRDGGGRDGGGRTGEGRELKAGMVMVGWKKGWREE